MGHDLQPKLCLLAPVLIKRCALRIRDARVLLTLSRTLFPDDNVNWNWWIVTNQVIYVLLVLISYNSIYYNIVQVSVADLHTKVSPPPTNGPNSLFLCTFSPKRPRVRIWCPQTKREILDPPLKTVWSFYRHILYPNHA